MTTISTVTSATATAATKQAEDRQPSKISSDFDTFLKMLTAQLENQDPTDPMDSDDYAVQLATFSSVEQQTKTNDILTSIQSDFRSQGFADLAGWIGKEARSSAAVTYDGSAVAVLIDPVDGATSATLVVRDAKGSVVSRETIPPTATSYQWLGADATGSPLPSGTYSLSVESQRGTDAVTTRPIEHYAKVVEARTGSEGTQLVLAGGVTVAAGSVTGIRAAQN